ncbi:hypothetical protein PLICRDRAFT_45285 [Plicaturopsis crispa FD-325 SS-3]|uniref:MYND-type domain-containing protein n=1 Tax=Plicaturopsis crispa FD-325 SS-3 TaxID=944288 RepID=A0A0C9TA30_PLICR|nr:hypothetical protein PLICRDRAFT_45285 [Plicaturopsis crispa FD-325 SS-3]
MATEALGLHEISTLLNYERASTEPRFRHAKLREVASVNGAFETIRFPPDLWGSPQTDTHKRGFVFDTVRPTVFDKDKPDLPSNMVAETSTVTASAKGLTEGELELIYREARDHDGCYTAITLFQHFFDLFPASTPLRVRTASGADFETTISIRTILEFDMQGPRQVTLSTVFPQNQTYITGSDYSSPHAVLGFACPGAENIWVVADLASMQFGSKGRGSGGELFQLETMDKWHEFTERVAHILVPTKRDATRIGPHAWGDPWLKKCAKRVKARWENREAEPWCGYCGAPAPTKRCPCKGPWYCSPAHQKLVWKYHKRFCTATAKK